MFTGVFLLTRSAGPRPDATKGAPSTIPAADGKLAAFQREDFEFDLNGGDDGERIGAGRAHGEFACCGIVIFGHISIYAVTGRTSEFSTSMEGTMESASGRDMCMVSWPAVDAWSHMWLYHDTQDSWYTSITNAFLAIGKYGAYTTGRPDLCCLK